MRLNVPTSAKSPLTGTSTRRDGLDGDPAFFYGITRGVTVVVNTSVAAVLSLVSTIVSYPATSITGNVAVWGPHTDALSPNTWKLTVTQSAPNQHSYVLEGKGKTEADSAYRVILSGSHVSTGVKLGSGSFLIDWDKAQQLPEHDTAVGTATVTYSRTSTSDTTTVGVQFTKVRDGETGQLVDATYAYEEVPNNGGSFDFSQNKNLVPGAAIEVLTVRSRWLQSGAGRSDVKVVGGDVAGGEATANECWDSSFLSRFFTLSFDATKNYGQSSACVFSTAEYATP
ncbi:MAG: hypothetical protein JNG84_10185 [Archangium sp.]|nr:hypothetical protein [Archangium sp.]